MRHPTVLIAAAALLIAACSPPDGKAGKPPEMALDQAPAKASLEVSSPAFVAGGDIPKTYSAFGERATPPLAWSPGPAGTKAYALIVQDPDAPTPRPFVHWIVFDIPAGVTALEQNRLPRGAVQGNNSAASASWFSLSPPPGPAHAYHFQVFALDRPLGLKQGAGREEVVDAMNGRVLASGELIGRYKAG